MSKYVIEFSKMGIIKYTSHLDMVRLFKRTFKKADIHLAHSHGFNPHPKMTFPLPLSLGYESNCELLEIEIDESKTEMMTGDEIVIKMNDFLPEGIHINSCKPSNKNYASNVCGAEYMIGFPIELICTCHLHLETEIGEDGELKIVGEKEHEVEEDDMEKIEKYKASYWEKFADRFLAQDEIIVKKKAKAKKGKGRKSSNSPKFKEIDIKPMINEISFNMVYNNVFLTTKLNAGSKSNLSPELLMTAVIDFARLATKKEDIKYLRTEIFFND